MRAFRAVAEGGSESESCAVSSQGHLAIHRGGGRALRHAGKGSVLVEPETRDGQAGGGGVAVPFGTNGLARRRWGQRRQQATEQEEKETGFQVAHGQYRGNKVTG